MRRFAAALALFALLAEQAAAAEAGRIITLAVPRAAAANENIVLRVQAGTLRRGMEIDVYSGDILLGTVSPFGLRGAREAGTYTIPVRTPIQGRQLRIRAVLTDAGQPDRAPTAGELRGVTLAFVRKSS